MSLITWLLRIGLFVLLVIFATQNSEITTLNYYQDQALELPLSVIMLIFFSLGVGLTYLSMMQNK